MLLLFVLTARKRDSKESCRTSVSSYAAQSATVHGKMTGVVPFFSLFKNHKMSLMTLSGRDVDLW